MISLTFAPERNTFIEAADSYSAIWAREGNSIVEAIEKNVWLTFKSQSMKAIVYEGPSQSHPSFKLRASYDDETKEATLIHELLHIISADYMLKLPVAGDALTLGLHRQIDLVLYDLWIELFGKAFADRQVQIESGRTPIYKEAWQWALVLAATERHQKFVELLAN